jgi:hypothetical protein
MANELRAEDGVARAVPDEPAAPPARSRCRAERPLNYDASFLEVARAPAGAVRIVQRRSRIGGDEDQQ